MLRQKNVLDISTVQYAILETNGNLSVFPYPAEKPASARDAGLSARPQYLPITIISDGKLLRQNLRVAGKDEAWLHRTLKSKSATLETTWLLTVDKGGSIIFYGKEIP